MPVNVHGVVLLAELRELVDKAKRGERVSKCKARLNSCIVWPRSMHLLQCLQQQKKLQVVGAVEHHPVRQPLQLRSASGLLLQQLVVLWLGDHVHVLRRDGVEQRHDCVDVVLGGNAAVVFRRELCHKNEQKSVVYYSNVQSTYEKAVLAREVQLHGQAIGEVFGRLSHTHEQDIVMLTTTKGVRRTDNNLSCDNPETRNIRTTQTAISTDAILSLGRARWLLWLAKKILPHFSSALRKSLCMPLLLRASRKGAANSAIFVAQYPFKRDFQKKRTKINEQTGTPSVISNRNNKPGIGRPSESLPAALSRWSRCAHCRRHEQRNFR